MTRTQVVQEKILTFYRTYGRWPTGSVCRSVSERSMSVSFLRYVQRDAEFAAKVKRMGWVSRDERVAARKDAILAFFKKNGRWPSSYSESARERGLSNLFRGYMCPTHTSFDASFAREVLKRGYLPLHGSAIRDEFPRLVAA
jgi:hypothetical protein